MDIVNDADIAIWVCPAAHEVREYLEEDGRRPDRDICSHCGKPYLKRCPNGACPMPTYRWSDYPTRFHHCGEEIPWARDREQRIVWEWPENHSALIGTKKLSAVEKVIKSRFSAPRADDSQLSEPPTVAPPGKPPTVQYFRPAETPSVPKELTPQERQDLIVPPSGRLPTGPKPVDVTTDLDLSGFENINRYLSKANAAIDKPPRKLVRAVLDFLRGRGERIGRGADQGLEDAATWVVKGLALVLVVYLLSLVGIKLAKDLIPGL